MMKKKSTEKKKEINSAFFAKNALKGAMQFLLVLFGHRLQSKIDSAASKA